MGVKYGLSPFLLDFEKNYKNYKVFSNLKVYEQYPIDQSYNNFVENLFSIYWLLIQYLVIDKIW